MGLRVRKSLKREFFITVGVIVGIFLLVGLYLFGRYFFEKERQIKDLNGENNKQLAHITSDMIEGMGEDYRNIHQKVLSVGTKSSGVKGHYENRDNQKSTIKVKMFSGLYVANAYLGNGQEVTYEIESEVKSGNFAIFICDEEHHILYEIPIDQAFTISFLAEENKVYYVKFAGESANISVKVERE